MSAANDSTTVADSTKAFLAEHPRLLGFVFAVMVALSQSGSVAGAGQAQIGP